MSTLPTATKTVPSTLERRAAEPATSTAAVDPPPDDPNQKPLPPTGGDDPRFTFTATVTLEKPSGTPDPNTYYVFTGQPALTGFHNDASVGTPDNHDRSILAWNISFTVLATLVVALRIWTRTSIVKAIGVDDALVLLALLSAFAIMSLNIVAVHFRMGWHTGDLGPDGITVVQKFHWLAQIVYAVCLGFAKLSMLTFILRLHPAGAFRWYRYVIFVCLFFVASFMLASMMVTIKTCNPITGIYDTSIISVCLDRRAILFSISSLNVFTDVLIVCLPIPMVLRVQIPVKQKIALSVVFCMGLFVCVASAVRMTTLNQLATSGDPSWVMAKFSIWTAIEYDLAIICASIPTLKPFLNKVLPALLSSRLATIISRRIGLRSSRFSSLQENVKTSAATDGSIQMKNLALKKESNLDNTWPPKIPGEKVQVTTTDVFYSGNASSDEHIISKDQGIVKTTNIDVSSREGHWPHSSQSSFEP